MAENRYHILLGLPEEVQNPDYYQLLEIKPGENGDAAIDEAFKRQMNRLQSVHSPKHKEFVEFLKGEVRKARKVLSDDGRRAAYDKEVSEEKLDQIRKYMTHLLVDGKLSTMAEISLITEGQNMGLEKAAIERVIEEEMAKAGAKRVSSSETDPGSQREMTERIQDAARDIEMAKLDGILAQARAQRADWREKKAEEKEKLADQRARAAADKERKAKEQLRAAIVKERVIEAREKQTDQRGGPTSEIARLRGIIDDQDAALKNIEHERAFYFCSFLSLVFFTVLQIVATAYPRTFEFADRALATVVRDIGTTSPAGKILMMVVVLLVGVFLMSLLTRVSRVLGYLAIPVVAALVFVAARVLS